MKFWETDEQGFKKMTNESLCEKCIKSIEEAKEGQGVCIQICSKCNIKTAYQYVNQLNHTESDLHWILAKFLRDSLDFLSEDTRAKGMRRMDWINEWITTEMPRSNQWIPRFYVTKNIYEP